MFNVTTSISSIVEGCNNVASGGRKTFYFHRTITSSDLRDINHGFRGSKINAAIEVDGSIIRVRIL